MERIGTMTLGNRVDITDPCYDRNVWCRMTTECEPGEYTGYVNISDEDEWGKRVAFIAIYKEDNIKDFNLMENIGQIGVDAGLAGFFNDKPDFPDNKWREFLKESGVFKADGKCDYSKNYYDCGYGLFSESAYGDGWYDVYATPERDAFMIIFIDR